MTRTIHFVYSVPRSGNIVRRGFDKLLSISHIPPLYRTGIDFFIPWRKPVRAPHSISYNLLHTLKKYERVRYYSLYEKGVIHLDKNDILLGTPTWDTVNTPPLTTDPNCIFARTVEAYPDHKNTYFLMPYSNDPNYLRWADAFIKKHGKNLILIGGKIWERDWDNSPWNSFPIQKKLHVEMCVNPNDYPYVKETFNEKGERGFLYIGHTAWYKNTKQLEDIAERMPGYKFGHIGLGTIKGWKKIADFADIDKTFMEKMAQDYDCFVNVSRDAQATTVLEQICFGMFVACTPETGYDFPSLMNLSMHDTDHNVEQLRRFQTMDEEEIKKHVRNNKEQVLQKNSWELFTSKITSFLELK